MQHKRMIAGSHAYENRMSVIRYWFECQKGLVTVMSNETFLW